jgi:hypothetical protein
MAKRKIVMSVLLFVLILTACSSSDFDGSRIGNEHQFMMEYKVLNTTDVQLLEVKQGESVSFEIVSTAGKLDIVLQKDRDEPVYQGSDIPTGSFQVKIAESGTYTCSVTGKKAKGSVSIVVKGP